MITNLCAIDSGKCGGCSGRGQKCPAFYQKIDGEWGSYLLMGSSKFFNNPREKNVRQKYRRPDAEHEGRLS
jgi:hypothetical protein